MTSTSNDNKNIKKVSNLKEGEMAGTGSSWQEAAFGLLAGVAYGAVTPVVGHPFDSIKTRMQADPMFQGSTVRQTVTTIYRTEGILGFYRGFIPPLIGSMAFRGVLFSAYSGTYAAAEQVPMFQQPIPYTYGLRPSVLLGATASAMSRALIESPFDYIKVRYMVGQTALSAANDNTNTTIGQTVKTFAQNPVTSIQQLYRGFGATLFRTFGLVGSFFIMVDYSVRFIPSVINAPMIGPFFKGGICATAAWFFAFPFETAKSVIQAEGKYKGMPTFQVIYHIYQEKGIVKGLYRGFGPGASRSFVANGASMMAYSWLQDNIRR